VISNVDLVESLIMLIQVMDLVPRMSTDNSVRILTKSLWGVKEMMKESHLVLGQDNMTMKLDITM